MNRKTMPRLFIAVLIGLGIAAALIYREHLTPDALETFTRGLGVWGPLTYIAIYVIATVFLLPGSWVTLAGGALFGPYWGALYVLVGSVTGATLALLVARYLAREWVEKKATGMTRRVMEGVDAEGWRFVAFTRLVPLFPFNLLNYALGLTRIPLLTYILTSAVFMLPGIAGYVYLGYVGREALLGGSNLDVKIAIGVGIFATLVFLPFFIRRLRRNPTATR
jgi:uncharacterized membrane protein YdjX (TVP38/TMEM64 family)